MSAKFTDSILVATLLTLSSSIAFGLAPTRVAAQSSGTIFRCIKYNKGFATIAQRGDRVTPPAITWNAKLGSYTPEKRCRLVSQKLTQVVALNGGKLRNLVLITGTLNRQKVVCVINSSVSTACNSANLLFTLQPKNAIRQGEVAAKLHNFSVMGTGSPVEEFVGTTPRPLFTVKPQPASSADSLPLEGLNQFLGEDISNTNWF